MAITIQLNELTATWDGAQWAGDARLSALLNECRALAVGYLPQEVSARAMATRALGNAPWRITQSDPQPTEKGRVY